MKKLHLRSLKVKLLTVLLKQ